MAADPDGRQDLCVAVASTVVAALSIADDDKAEQDRFVEWFNALDTPEQVFLTQYLYYGLLMIANNYSIEVIGPEVYGVCMERRA